MWKKKYLKRILKTDDIYQPIYRKNSENSKQNEHKENHSNTNQSQTMETKDKEKIINAA